MEPAVLAGHVEELAGRIGERNLDRYANLERAREYIEVALREVGYEVRHDAYKVARRECYNVIAELGSGEPIFVVGSHYDTAPCTPGADDNASAVAALLELARSLAGWQPRGTIRWIAFTLEEPPYFRTRAMGSRVHARLCRKKGERLLGMISLEMLGYYDDRPRSQLYPLSLMRWFYPDAGNFIGVAGHLRSRHFIRRFASLLRQSCDIPVEKVALPVPGVGLSDNWSFWKEGYPSAMVTDTAFFRNPHYHRPSDLPDTLDYNRMATLVAGLTSAIKELMVGRDPGPVPDPAGPPGQPSRTQ